MSDLTEPLNLNVTISPPTAPVFGDIVLHSPTNAEQAAAAVIGYSANAASAYVTSAGAIISNVVNAAANIFEKPVATELDVDTSGIVGSIGDITGFVTQQETDIKAKFDTLMTDLDADVVAFMSKIEQPQSKTDTLIDGLGQIIDQLNTTNTADIEAAYAAGAAAVDNAVSAFDNSASQFNGVIALFNAGQTDFTAVQAQYTVVVAAYVQAATRFDTVITAYQDAISGYEGVIANIDGVASRFDALSGDYNASQVKLDSAADAADVAADAIRDAVNEMRSLILSLTNSLSSSGITSGLSTLDAQVLTLQSSYTQEINLRGQMIWELGRDRFQREADREVQVAYERAASRGFSMPSIVSAGAVDRAAVGYGDKLVDLAKERTIEEITRQRDSLQFAIKLSVDTRIAIVNARIAAEQFVTDAKLRGFDSMIRSSASLMDAARARIEAARASIEGVNAKRQGIEAQLQAALAQQKAVDAKVSGVDATLKGAQAALSAVDGQLRGADAKLRGAEAKLEGAKAALEGAKAGLEVGRAKLQGADAKIKIGDAKARLAEVILNIRNAIVGATSQAISAMGGYINAQVNVLQAKTQPRTQFFQSYSQLSSVLANLFSTRFQAASVVVSAELSKNDIHNRNAVAAANATNQAATAIATILAGLGEKYCDVATSSLSSLNAISTFGSQEITSGDT